MRQKRILKVERYFQIFERIRDIHVLENYVVLFLETTGTIGIYKKKFLGIKDFFK